MPRGRYVAVGRVGRPHGVRGEVRVDSLGGMPRGLAGYTRFYLGDGKTEPQEVQLTSHRRQGRLLVVGFAGCESPEAARAHTHRVLYVERAELPPLEEGEYYHVDLLNCRVVDAQGDELGRVVDVFATAGHDVLVVASGRREWMLPVVAQYVTDMDLERGVIEADVPDELRG